MSRLPRWALRRLKRGIMWRHLSCSSCFPISAHSLPAGRSGDHGNGAALASFG